MQTDAPAPPSPSIPPDNFRLMQFADSAFPLGGYAFSNGLEWLVKRGCITDLPGFTAYLRELARQAFYFGIPFLLSMRLKNDEPRAAAERFNRMMFVPGARKASRAQGIALRRLFPVLTPAQEGAALHRRLENSAGINDHFVLVLGILLDHLGWSPRQSAELYWYLMIRDQVSAAVRLGALGAVSGLGVQNEIFAHLKGYSADEAPHYSQAVRIALLPEIAMADHTALYTKLFQN